jgi:hypothetical protein
MGMPVLSRRGPRSARPLALAALAALALLAGLLGPGAVAPADAQATMNAQSIVLSPAELGAGWQKAGERERTVAGTNLYEIAYAGPSGRLALFTIGVAPNADVAEAIITAVKPEGATSVQGNAFGDGRAFKLQASAGQLQYTAYVFRVRNVFAFTEHFGAPGNTEAEAQARAQERKMWALFSAPATATPVPPTPAPPTATPPPAIPTPIPTPVPVPPVATPEPAPVPPVAQGPLGCRPGEQPEFVFGFAAMKERLGDRMGTPISCEYGDPAGSGDTLQDTSTGLAFYRKSTNTPTSTNGFEHWGLTSAGLVYWTGSSIDPTPDAEVIG